MPTQPLNAKPFWQSKTLIGLVVAFLGPWLAQRFGLTLDDAAQQVVVDQLVQGIGAALAVYGRLKANTALHAKAPGPNAFALPLAGLLVWGVGCASFSTRIEERNEDGSERITIIQARTLFDSQSELAKLKTSHTDKTQSVTLGSLAQESSGSNVVSLVEALATGIAKGLKP